MELFGTNTIFTEPFEKFKLELNRFFFFNFQNKLIELERTFYKNKNFKMDLFGTFLDIKYNLDKYIQPIL